MKTTTKRKKRTKSNCNPDQTPHAIRYRRGCRYRRELNAAGRLTKDHDDPRAYFRPLIALPPFGQMDWRWRIADRLAEEYGIDRITLRIDGAFAIAVDNIVASCANIGLLSARHVRRLLIANHPRLSAKVILSVSRMAPPRQRYAVNEASQDRNPLKKPPDNIHVFDTTHFGEVISRLARAGGLLESSLRTSGASSNVARASAARSAKVHERLCHLRQCSARLRQLIERADLRSPDASESECCSRTEPPRQAKKKANGASTFLAAVGCAIGFLEKTVRDFNDPPWDEIVHMSATPSEKARAFAWFDRIDDLVARGLAGA